jgi:hypothetical protein
MRAYAYLCIIQTMNCQEHQEWRLVTMGTDCHNLRTLNNAGT